MDNQKSSRKRPGIRHIDRLMDSVLDIVEDENQAANTRLEASKLGFEILKKRSPVKHKTDKTKALEKMLTGPPKS